MPASLSRLLKTTVVSSAIFKLFVSECVRANEIPFFVIKGCFQSSFFDSFQI
jgi:hypothetical protein